MRHILMLITLLVSSQLAVSETNSHPTYMPVWQLKTQQGDIVKSSDFAGKPLILHFWATWCPYCKKLQPGLDQLAQKYRAQGLQMLAISLLEQPGAKPQTELENRGISFTTLVNGESLGVDFFNIQGTPTTVFIAPDGKVLGQTTQADPSDPQWDQVMRHLVQLPR